MRYISFDEAKKIDGPKPYAYYGAKVYSFLKEDGSFIVHGSTEYAKLLEKI